MSPDDEVQITVTRGEAMRMWSALNALCELQKMMPGMPSAMALSDAVEDIEKILPRLEGVFPQEFLDKMKSAPSMSLNKADTKTYAEGPSVTPLEFDVPVASLKGISKEEAAAIFATEYDGAIRAVLSTLSHYTDFSNDDFMELLDNMKALMETVVPVPKDLTVSKSQPYVAVSDLLTLGALAFETYQRQDQIEDKTKPF
jgi:hypothetical protein